MTACVPDSSWDVLWRRSSSAADSEVMRLIVLTARGRWSSHVESLRAACSVTREWARGQTRDFDGIKGCEKGGCVTVEIQQASNYLPTGALTPWKRSALFRAGISCLNMTFMLSYGQYWWSIVEDSTGSKKQWDMIRCLLCSINSEDGDCSIRYRI